MKNYLVNDAAFTPVLEGFQQAIKRQATRKRKKTEKKKQGYRERTLVSISFLPPRSSLSFIVHEMS